MAILSISDLTYKTPILGLMQELSGDHEKNVQTYTGLPTITIVAGSTQLYNFNANGYITENSSVTLASSAAVTAGGAVGEAAVVGSLSSLSLSGSTGSPVSFSASILGALGEGGTVLINATELGDIAFCDDVTISGSGTIQNFSINLNWELDPTYVSGECTAVVFKSFSGTMSVSCGAEESELTVTLSEGDLDSAAISIGGLDFSVTGVLTKETLVSGVGEVPVVKKDYTLSSLT